MSDWDNTGAAMGFDVEGRFVSTKEGANEVVTYISHEHVPCTQNEVDQNLCGQNGKTIEYRFKSPVTGNERILRRASKGLFYAFKSANINPNDTVRLERTGSGPSDTRYNIVVLNPEEVQAWVEQKKKETPMPEQAPPLEAPPVNQEEVDINSLPF